jgi:twitching motility protein PilU
MPDIFKLLSLMMEHDASDLYITVDAPPSYRVNGVVRPAGNKPLDHEQTESMAVGILNEKQQQEFFATNEANLALHLPALGRFRVNVFRQRGHVGLVVRRIKSDIASIDDLNLPPIFKEISSTKRGLVLIVGATGSGKSTTMAAMIDFRNASFPGHIITVEDPVEFVYENRKSIVTQREVGLDTESYHSALKNALRQAPDVIVIGEVRDSETMEAAITFAETGHLCLATLHANNANQAMERIMSFFPQDRHRQIYMMLSMNMRGIVSQRLVKRKDGQGRIAAVEIMLDSPRVKDLILKGETADLKEAMEKGATIGMQTFDSHLFQLFNDGMITEEEALRNSDSANNLRLRIKLAEDPDLGSSAKAFKQTAA